MKPLHLKNARICDGSGRSPVRGEVFVSGGRIRAVGPSLPGDPGAEEIDLGGSFLLPGFIDVHTHSEAALVNGSFREEAVLQGVTTEICGNCGIGLAPLTGTKREYLYLARSVTGMPDEDVPTGGIGALLHARKAYGTNFAVLAAHSPLRAEATGFGDEEMTPEGMERMRSLLRTAFREGACGFSTGLAYYPAAFCATWEITELCRVAGEFGLPFCIHQRSVANRYFPEGLHPLEEAFRIAEESGVHLQLSHYKTRLGSLGRTAELLEPVEDGLQRGISVTADFYPYPVGCGSVAVVLPLWVMDGGFKAALARLRDPALTSRIASDIAAAYPGAGEYTFTHAPAHPDWVDRRFSDMAGKQGVSVQEMLVRFLAEEELDGGYMPLEREQIETDRRFDGDFAELLRKEYYMVGSDTLPTHMHPHPRSDGAFTRTLEIARTHGIPPEMIARRLAGRPAEVFRLGDRGGISPGRWADLILLDGEYRVRDVWINGTGVVRDGACLHRLAGMPAVPVL